MKLYDVPFSGNCYKIRLFLSLLGKEYESVPINFTHGDHLSPSFQLLNPRGQVPVLEDDGVVIWDSTAILVYLARRYGGESWLPLDAKDLALVTQWLAVAQNEILYGLARARAVLKLKRPWNLQECQKIGQDILKVLQNHLAQHPWLALDRVTIADIACFPYVALAPEGDVPLGDYPAVLQWISRIKALAGYRSMPGID